MAAHCFEVIALVLVSNLAAGCIAGHSEDPCPSFCDPACSRGLSVTVANIEAPREIIFDRTNLGGRDVKAVRVSNTGDGPLFISDVQLVEDSGDEQREFLRGERFPTEQVCVEPGDTYALEVVWSPQDTASDKGELIITSNSRERADRSKVVALVSPEIGPRILAPRQLSFPVVAVGDDATLVTFVANEGEAPLRIDDILLTPDSSGEFSLSYPVHGARDDPSQDATEHAEVIEPGESIDVRVTFTPRTEQPSVASKVIVSNDPRQARYTIAIEGNVQR